VCLAVADFCIFADHHFFALGGNSIDIPASKHPVFSAGKALKDAVNAKKKK
jgi:hypothetical protein